jgi:hypothetical protein
VFFVPEAFVIAAELEPGLGVPRPGGLLIIPKGDARIEGNILRECAGLFQSCAKVDCLGHVERDRVWHWLRRGNGEKYGHRDLCQSEQLGVFDMYWAGRAIWSGLVEVIYQEEDISAPNDLSGGIE